MPTIDSGVRISLTQFLNFATKPPEQQLTVVREIKKQHLEGYQVPPDCYKQFREAVVHMHKNGLGKGYLDQVASSQTEATRVKHYPELADGYKKFMGRKTLVWFEPQKGVWSCQELLVNVRPEIALVVNGQPRLIKLWLNDDQSLNKRRSELITHMMRLAIPSLQDDCQPAVLDVRSARLFEIGKSDADLSVLLSAQAMSFVHMYRVISV